jgi:aryl-alcohol dehydrogenase-like predicted oxidoreductase
MKLGIGTAQFGLDYGISNPNGKTPPKEVARILDVAVRSGVCLLDTAPAYGTSEEVLGKTLPQESFFEIVTKTPIFSQSVLNRDRTKILEDTFYQSLERLNQSFLYGLLIHRAEDLLADGGEQLLEKMLELKEKKLVKKVGVSVYSSEQINRIISKYSPDLIQVPINIFDQRLLFDGTLRKLKNLEIEIHARSIFLQGLLLMLPEQLPPYFNSIEAHHKNYSDTLHQYGISPVQAAIAFVKGLDEVDRIIVGINHLNQFKEVIRAANTVKNLEPGFFDDFAISDESILNPSYWEF